LSSRGRSFAAIALAGLVVASCSGSSVTPAPSTPAPLLSTAPRATPSGQPRFAHIYVIVLENEEYSSLVGSAAAPFLNGLIATSGLATNYFGVAHPSQPNYLALFSGSTQGVTDDGNHDLAGTNLADQLEAAGKTWNVFAQDYPGGCFTGATKGGKGEGVGAAGSYARKHDPAISFTDISSNPARCARITNFAAFDPTAADFELIVPNQCNDMHSCPIATGDSFLSTFVPRITSSPAFANSVLFITTDEGSSDTSGGGQVLTLVVSPLAKAGFASKVHYDHYSLLRTIEDAWGLPCLGQACSASDMADFFK
jgi:phosphatidylinositol-3-phosphatase